MKLNQVAVQLYTLRDFLKTPAEIAASMKKVRAIGYTAVQESGLGPIEVKEWLSILKNEGLTLIGTHEDSKLILDDPEQVVTRLKERGVTHTAYPWPHVEMKTQEDLNGFAKRLDHSGEVLRKAGCVLTYHNHHVEFRHIGGKTILEQLYSLTDPRNLQGEIDTYWVQSGGADSVDWCRRLHGRLPWIHMKDFVINDKNEAIMAEIGHGNMDFHAIVGAAEAAGCKWFIVEQDVCPADPFDSLAKSFKYVSTQLVKE
ncbi:MAG: sugar phosphate isomerase/epimerase [candidate division FCPU426 bacterium]